jgi:Fe-S-cluster containining protein
VIPLLPSETSTREATCLSCREKSCCSYYIVSVTAQDVWRIMRALHISSSDFLRYWERDSEAPGRFLLSPDGAFCELVLAKRPLPEPLLSPCVFLLRTSDGHGVCGLGDLRPGQCRAYPVFQHGDLIRLVNDPQGCVQTWSYGDLDLERERPLLARQAADERQHHALVADWNIRVRAERRERTFEEFCSYLINHCADKETAA